MPQYEKFQESRMDELIGFYRNYYNARGGTWTYEKAFRRIHQMVTMEDSLVILRMEAGRIVGFMMGYSKCFDDSTGFFLEEILIDGQYQNRGYGTQMLEYLTEQLRKTDCKWIELLTTKDAMHQRFYGKNGYQCSGNLVLLYKDL